MNGEEMTVSVCVQGLMVVCFCGLACGCVLEIPLGGGSYSDATSQGAETTLAVVESSSDVSMSMSTGGASSLGSGHYETSGPPDFASGNYLFALSTTVDAHRPFLFFATVDVIDDTSLTLSLQPLTLDVGKVTTPRQPLGEPLVFNEVAVVDGTFSVDLGIVMVGGFANPITGASFVLLLNFAGAAVDVNFFCGAVTGEVLEPPLGSVDGSSFAAIRVGGLNDLPNLIPINCAGDTVTDP